MAKNSALKREPSQYTRLSPGIYRNQQGQLSGPGGTKLPTQPPAIPQSSMQPQRFLPASTPPTANKPMLFPDKQGQQNISDLIAALSKGKQEWNLPTIQQPEPQPQVQKPYQTTDQLLSGPQSENLQYMRNLYDQFMQWMKSRQGQ